MVSDRIELSSAEARVRSTCHTRAASTSTTNHDTCALSQWSRSRKSIPLWVTDNLWRNVQDPVQFPGAWTLDWPSSCLKWTARPPSAPPATISDSCFQQPPHHQQPPRSFVSTHCTRHARVECVPPLRQRPLAARPSAAPQPTAAALIPWHAFRSVQFDFGSS